MSPQIETVLNHLTYMAVWASLLPLSVGVLRLKKLTLGGKLIVALLAITFLTDFMLGVFGDSEQFLLYMPRTYTLIEFLVISVYFVTITSRINLRRAMYLLIVPFLGVVVADFLVEGLAKRDDLSVGIESLLFIVYSLITLYNILRDAEYSNLLSTPHFWIISAILLYFGGNIFVFISTNYIAQISMEMYGLLWGIHAVIAMLFYSVLSIGLWKAKGSR